MEHGNREIPVKQVRPSCGECHACEDHVMLYFLFRRKWVCIHTGFEVRDPV